jgi:predicted RNA-binding protein with RPS1 domain
MPKNLVVNKSLVVRPGDKVYSHEPYAQDLYNMISGQSMEVYKDLRDGQIVRVLGVSEPDENGYATIDIPGFVPVYIQYAGRELDFWKYNRPHTVTDNAIKSVGWFGWAGNSPVEVGWNVMITSSAPFYQGSFYEAHISKLKERFHTDLGDQKNWYVAKILEKNKGGFIVDVGGIRCFLPGSLAAANKIIDFDAYVGKDVRVMVESYMHDIDMFVVSNKKYIQQALPELIDNLDLGVLYGATVTGTAPFGIFLEFEEILTGLLHVSEMSEATREAFQNHEFVPGSTMEVWIKEIGKDRRIILTETDPNSRKQEILELKSALEGTTIENAIVKVVKHYGALIDLKNGHTGLLPNSELKKFDSESLPSPMSVIVDEVNANTGKILLKRARRPRRQPAR